MTRDELTKLISSEAIKIAEKTLEREIYATNELFRYALCLYLHDKEGYGKKRLQRALLYFEDVLDSYADGLISIDDMKETVESECGTVFTLEGEIKCTDVAQQEKRGET